MSWLVSILIIWVIGWALSFIAIMPERQIMGLFNKKEIAVICLFWPLGAMVLPLVMCFLIWNLIARR